MVQPLSWDRPISLGLCYESRVDRYTAGRTRRRRLGHVEEPPADQRPFLVPCGDHLCRGRRALGHARPVQRESALAYPVGPRDLGLLSILDLLGKMRLGRGVGAHQRVFDVSLDRFHNRSDGGLGDGPGETQTEL